VAWKESLAAVRNACRQAAYDEGQLTPQCPHCRGDPREVIASATIQSRSVCDPLAKSVALDISATKKSTTSYCQSTADTEEPIRRLGRKSVTSDSEPDSEEEATRPAKRTRAGIRCSDNADPPPPSLLPRPLAAPPIHAPFPCRSSPGPSPKVARRTRAQEKNRSNLWPLSS
jgi:hypothetical protein